MNCQDISRIVDTGNVSKLGEVERRMAESHARTCRDCAAIWGVQSQLAAVRVPATPPELAAQLRTLAALPDRPARGRSARRLTVIGCMVAVAAAAALLVVRPAGTPTAPPVKIIATAPEVEAVPPAVQPVAAPAPVPAAPRRQRDQPTPLLPPPYLGPQLAMAGIMSVEFVDLALEKAVERHPELAEGPQVEGTFLVGVALNADGSVLTSAIRHAQPGGVPAISPQIDALIPGEGGLNAWRRPKSTRLRDGRTLRADALLTVRRIPKGFDLSRSRARVLQILGDKYDYLLAPAAGGALNRLEVFLSDDGRILRERMDIVRRGDSGTSLTEDPAEVARFGESLAARLGLESSRIGVVGVTSVTRGLMNPVFKPTGGRPAMPDMPRMLLTYAWERRAGESAPTLGGTAPPQGINQAAALAIAERYLPDAFSARAPDAGEPAILLTARGEFIRAGSLPPGTLPFAVLKTLREQLAGGTPLERAMKVKLTNASGLSAEVYFAWERAGAATTNSAE